MSNAGARAHRVSSAGLRRWREWVICSSRITVEGEARGHPAGRERHAHAWSRAQRQPHRRRRALPARRLDRRRVSAVVDRRPPPGDAARPQRRRRDRARGVERAGGGARLAAPRRGAAPRRVRAAGDDRAGATLRSMIDATTSALSIAASVRAGKTRAREVVAGALERIARRDRALNAFTAVLGERALADADTIDGRLAAGDDPGPLAGVPFAAKNLFDVAGLATLAGSKINADHPPATRDATAVARLRAAGAVLVGALNMDLYAFGFTTENSHHGPTRNPHDPARVAGGSSGGSAAAVAGGLVPLALGSDTNGSIRVPASFCGIFGLKPTYGRLSRAHTFPFVTSLDHVGPFARSVGDLALAYDAMQGHDPDDPVCAQRPAELTLPRIDDGIDGLKIAIAGGYFRKGAAT